MKNKFSACWAEEGGDAVDTPADDNAVLVWTAGADYSRNNAMVY